jgi:chemotaxis protein MotA
MLTLGGFAFLLVCVFGGYMAAGGSLGPILEALPYEMAIIGGAGVGTFIMANGIGTLKDTLKGFGRIVKGPRYRRRDYVDLLTLMDRLLRTLRTGGMAALEPHIEKPADSTIFGAFPKISKDKHTVHLICDYLRMVSMSADDPHQIEDLMARELRKDLQHALHPAHALQTLADSLPALGIVAAVMGVIKTMSYITEPPAVLGKMIGGALVGTFLGVLLAYGLVGPLASRLRGVVEEESSWAEVVRAVIVAHLHGHAAPVAIETGRKMVPHGLMPGFEELETALKEARKT